MCQSVFICGEMFGVAEISEMLVRLDLWACRLLLIEDCYNRLEYGERERERCYMQKKQESDGRCYHLPSPYDGKSKCYNQSCFEAQPL